LYKKPGLVPGFLLPEFIALERVLGAVGVFWGRAQGVWLMKENNYCAVMLHELVRLAKRV
jgi:hypothetical protein